MAVNAPVEPERELRPVDPHPRLYVLPRPSETFVGGAASGAAGGVFGAPAFVAVFAALGFAYWVAHVLQEDAQDRVDLEAARVARAEADERGTIPWTQLKAELGL